jgi:probable phosphoglycerate mutase
MTRILLIRHAATEMADRQIAGRTEHAPLSAAGAEQAQRLARALSSQNTTAVYTSPRERARQTADILAASWRAEARLAPELDEVDYGEWSGRTIEDLRSIEPWQAFNTIRSCTPIPNGELIAAVQARVVGFLQTVRERHPLETIAAVTHAEAVRSALVYYLGAPLDLMLRLEVSPGSVSFISTTMDRPSCASIGARSCIDYEDAARRLADIRRRRWS